MNKQFHHITSTNRYGGAGQFIVGFSIFLFVRNDQRPCFPYLARSALADSHLRVRVCMSTPGVRHHTRPRVQSHCESLHPLGFSHSKGTNLCTHTALLVFRARAGAKGGHVVRAVPVARDGQVRRERAALGLHVGGRGSGMHVAWLPGRLIVVGVP